MHMKTQPIIHRQTSPRILTPSNENKVHSDIREFNRTDSKQSLQPLSPLQRSKEHNLTLKLERLMEDNQQLMDHNSVLLEEINRLKEQASKQENQPFLEQKLNILITENERLTELLGQHEQLEKDNKNSKKRIAELLFKNKEQEKMIQMKDQLQARLEHTERIVCELDTQLQHQSVNELKTLQSTNNKLNKELKNSNEKILHLVSSNESLNQILEERLQQLESMNQLVCEQQDHYEAQLKKQGSNQLTEHDKVRKQNTKLTTTNQELNSQLKNAFEEKSALIKEKIQLQDQLAYYAKQERFLKNSIQSTQQKAESLEQELSWYRDENARINEEQYRQKELDKEQIVNFTSERDEMIGQVSDYERSLSQHRYEIENLKAQLKTSEDRILLLSEQITHIQSNASHSAANQEAIQHQHIGIYANENQLLKQQTQSLCHQNQTLSYQLQQITIQLEQAQNQVQRQQQQISLQNQRFAQVQREWENKEQIIVSETQGLILRIQQLEQEKGLKEISINQDFSLRSSMMDSPFKTLKLQNFYSKYETENKEPLVPAGYLNK